MANAIDPGELDYEVEAIRYPEDEPAGVTAQLMALLGQVLHRRRQVAVRLESKPTYPEIARYSELVLAVEGLIDCGGRAYPDYRAKLVGVAALALDALIEFDNTKAEAARVPEAG